jgi:hypothetical protein
VVSIPPADKADWLSSFVLKEDAMQIQRGQKVDVKSTGIEVRQAND